MVGSPEGATLKAYAIELLIVISGITVAFQIQKLDDNRRDAAAHATLRQGLTSELALDLDELDRSLRIAERVLGNATHAVELLAAEDRSSTGELESTLARVAQVTLPEVQSGQLDAYLESDLSATSTARPELISLRARLEELDQIGTYLTSYTLERFLPLLSPSFDFTNGKIMDSDAVWRFQMRNTVSLFASLIGTHLEAQQNARCAVLAAREALGIDEGADDPVPAECADRS